MLDAFPAISKGGTRTAAQMQRDSGGEGMESWPGSVERRVRNTGRCGTPYLSMKNGPGRSLIRCSVVEPSTIATSLEWCEVPMKTRSWPLSS